MISVIITTYKTPDALELCVNSIFNSNVTNPIELVIVVDGTELLNKKVIQSIKALDNDLITTNIIYLPANYGQPNAINIGVYNSRYDLLFLVNDDNVFSKNWDKILLDRYYNTIKNEKSELITITPNQIEPYPSIFKQFIFKDFGTDPATFDLDSWYEHEQQLRVDKIDDSGATFPLFLSKKDYMKVGGWDISYPYQAVTDWDFFLRLELCGNKFIRIYDCNLYHFVSVGTKNLDPESHKNKEIESHEYFAYKWGELAKHNTLNNSKMIRKWKI